MKALQTKIESLERELEAKSREISTLKLKLMQSEIIAREVVKQTRALASTCQHHLCFLDGTGRRDEV